MRMERLCRMFEDLDKGNKELETIFAAYFVGLVSSDTCITEENCKTSLEKLSDLKKALDIANVSDEFKNDYSKKIKIGIDIVERDLKDIKNGNFREC